MATSQMVGGASRNVYDRIINAQDVPNPAKKTDKKTDNKATAK